MVIVINGRVMSPWSSATVRSCRPNGALLPSPLCMPYKYNSSRCRTGSTVVPSTAAAVKPADGARIHAQACAETVAVAGPQDYRYDIVLKFHK
jgi:hypothetical protein